MNEAFITARAYLDSLPRPGRLSTGKAIMLVFLATLLTGCGVAAATQSLDQTPLPTFSPPGSPTPESTHTATVTATQLATLTSLAPILSLTPTIAAGIFAEQQMINFDRLAPISEYPGLLNAAGDESTGESFTTVLQVQDYFNARADAEPKIQQLDRAFGQLSLSVNPDQFKQRQLGLGWDGYGLGFSSADLPKLNATEMIFQADSDGYSRAWALTNAKGLEGMIYDGIVKFFTDVKKINPTNAQIQALFNQIIFGDFGIKAVDDGDGNPFTLNDHFTACQTYTGKAHTRLAQPEQARSVTFDPNVEITGNGVEEETVNRHDADNSVMVTMVTDGNTLWAEVFEAGNDPDPLNIGLDSFGEKAGSRVSWKRLVPCGVSAPAATVTPGETKPWEKTPIPPTPGPTYPSSTPQNPELTATPGPPPKGTPTQPVPPGPEPETPVQTPIIIQTNTPIW